MASETDTETEAEAQRLYQRGRFYLDCGLPEDALKPLTQVTELVPGSPRRGKKTEFRHASAVAGQGDWQAA